MGLCEWSACGVVDWGGSSGPCLSSIPSARTMASQTLEPVALPSTVLAVAWNIKELSLIPLAISLFDRLLLVKEAAHVSPRRQRECVTAAWRGWHRPRRRRTNGAHRMFPSQNVILSANGSNVELGGIEKLQQASNLMNRS